MSSNFRPVLPAPPSASNYTSETSSSNTSSRSSTTRQIINAACHACQRRKSKCDGVRPKCSACVRRLTDCSYETASAEETRTSALKRRNEMLEQRLSTFTELYELLQSASESDARTLLQLIRSSPDPETVLNTVREGQLLLQAMDTKGSTSTDTVSLPPIAKLIGVADRSTSTSPPRPDGPSSWYPTNPESSKASYTLSRQASDTSDTAGLSSHLRFPSSGSITTDTAEPTRTISSLQTEDSAASKECDGVITEEEPPDISSGS